MKCEQCFKKRIIMAVSLNSQLCTLREAHIPQWTDKLWARVCSGALCELHLNHHHKLPIVCPFCIAYNYKLRRYRKEPRYGLWFE